MYNVSGNGPGRPPGKVSHPRSQGCNFPLKPMKWEVQPPWPRDPELPFTFCVNLVFSANFSAHGGYSEVPAAPDGLNRKFRAACLVCLRPLPRSAPELPGASALTFRLMAAIKTPREGGVPQAPRGVPPIVTLACQLGRSRSTPRGVGPGLWRAKPVSVRQRQTSWRGTWRMSA